MIHYWGCSGCEAIVAEELLECPKCGAEKKPFKIRFGETRVFRLARQKLTWIDIKVEEAPGKPAAGFTYHVETADGEVFDGQLDADGRIRLVGIEAGTCKVTVSPSKPRPQLQAQTGTAQILQG